jgi:hypothetical protein
VAEQLVFLVNLPNNKYKTRKSLVLSKKFNLFVADSIWIPDDFIPTEKSHFERTKIVDQLDGLLSEAEILERTLLKRFGPQGIWRPRHCVSDMYSPVAKCNKGTPNVSASSMQSCDS